MDAVSRYERRVYGSLAVLLLLAAMSLPAWGMGRPDRVWGLALGIAAGAGRLVWTFFLTRRLATMSGARYAAGKLIGFSPLAAALAAAGLVEGISLYAAAFGVLFATAASIAGAVLELRVLAHGDQSGDATAEESPRYGRT